MSDLIRRQDAFRAVLGVTTYDTVDDVEIHCDASVAGSEGWLGGVRDALRAIEYVPTAEPERKKGEWIDGNGTDTFIHCSVCGREAYWDSDYGQQTFDFCPYCGVDMRGE